MIRRHIIAQDLRYSHKTTPRKQRTYAHTNVFNPTLLYRNLKTSWPNAYKKWVGKVFIPIGASPQQIFNRLTMAKKRDYITEDEIAQYAKPNYFRIIRVSEQNGKLILRSIINVNYRAPQLNIFLDTFDIIRDIRYF